MIAIVQSARASDMETWKASVPFNDLDLSSVAGQAALRDRMVSVVRGEYETGVAGDLTTPPANEALERRAVAAALVKADAVIGAARDSAVASSGANTTSSCVS